MNGCFIVVVVCNRVPFKLPYKLCLFLTYSTKVPDMFNHGFLSVLSWLDNNSPVGEVRSVQCAVESVKYALRVNVHCSMWSVQCAKHWRVLR